MSDEPEPTEEQSPSSLRWWIIGAGAFLAILIIGAVGALISQSSGSSDHKLIGSVLLTDTSDYWPNKQCTGSGGYSDLAQGGNVVLKDGNGKILATTNLATGRTINKTSCFFYFDLGNVPDSKFYSMQVSHRGELSYSLAEMKKQKWNLALTIGS